MYPLNETTKILLNCQTSLLQSQSGSKGPKVYNSISSIAYVSCSGAENYLVNAPSKSKIIKGWSAQFDLIFDLENPSYYWANFLAEFEVFFQDLPLMIFKIELDLAWRKLSHERTNSLSLSLSLTHTHTYSPFLSLSLYFHLTQTLCSYYIHSLLSHSVWLDVEIKSNQICAKVA